MEVFMLNFPHGIIDVRCFLVFSIVFLIIYDILKNKAPKNFPPGPWSLPIIGDIWRIDSTKLHLQIAQFSKQYGNIFSLRIGHRVVFLNSFKVVKEAFVQHAENLTDRPQFPLLTDLTGNKGLVGSNGYPWKEQRRFALSTLRYFGLGKRSLECSIQMECRSLIKSMENQQDRPFDPQLIIKNAVSNIICCLMFGERFDYADDQFRTLLKLCDEIIILQSGIWAQLHNVFPWIMCRIPGPNRKLFSHWNRVTSFVKSKIQEHKSDWDATAPRDYIDCFLSEIEKSKDDEKAGFDEKGLCFCALDLFLAGTDTTATTLYWGLLFMIKNQTVQERVQAEIDQMVGPSRLPSLADRADMPYTNAVIHEIQRKANIVPMNIPHQAKRDIALGGYTIPKGTMVMESLTSVLFDEAEWETPYSFNPEHFLDAEGNFRSRDAFLAFSTGRRKCLGESLARMELFLFFTSLLQKFTFSVAPGLDPGTEFRFGFILGPKPYKLCIVPR